MRIIGCGNHERGDDGAGLLVVERLRELGVESLGARTKTCSGEATEVMDAWAADDEVILVDAVVTGASAGTIHRWDNGIPLAGGSISASTHGFGVGEAIRLARALGRYPKSLRVYGIEGRQFELGTEISPEVRLAVENVAQQISMEIRSLCCR
jgi:hydrogenase maturation protease